MTTEIKTIHNMQTWDPSVIGMTPDDKEAMTEDEQREHMISEINRAADILQAVVAAFGEHMRPTERRILWTASTAIIRVAHATDPDDDRPGRSCTHAGPSQCEGCFR